MKTIGSHPGAILFRLGIMVILITILVAVFFTYVADVQKNTERAAITRTRGLINSSLAVVFATYAVQSRMSELNDIDDANPFEFLREYQMLPATYAGEIEHALNDRLKAGWYYQGHLSRVAYKPRYLDENFYFELVLDYDDINQSGRFEMDADAFKGLYFAEIDISKDSEER